MTIGRAIFQNAFVVGDLEAAIDRWVRELGIGPFFVFEQKAEAFQGLTYRGAPGELSMRMAIAQAGDLQIELVQPTGPGPSAFSLDLPPERPVFHHVAVWSDDFDADLRVFAARGVEIVNAGSSGGRVKFAYLDTRDSLGCMLEVLERVPGMEAMFASIRRASIGWDGERPVRGRADL